MGEIVQGGSQPVVHRSAADDQMADAPQPLALPGDLQGIVNLQRYHGGEGDLAVRVGQPGQ